MTARDDILQRVRTALADNPQAPTIHRDYDDARGTRGDIDLFTARASDYQATVYRCRAETVNEHLKVILDSRHLDSVLVPDRFPTEWLTDISTTRDRSLSTRELDAIAGVLTTCRLAVAETGTIILDHSDGQGRRALTLVPDYHLVIVRADQIVPNVPDAIAQLEPQRAMTWISGPSATSDIELHRVEGVHGPRTLDILIADDPPLMPATHDAGIQ